MTNPDSENLPEAPVAQPVVDPRRRLRELLAIPERDRSDEQWDEIIELEIQLAPGNRISAGEVAGGPAPTRGGGNYGKGGGNANQGQGQGQQAKKHRPRANAGRRTRQNKPPQNGGGNGAA